MSFTRQMKTLLLTDKICTQQVLMLCHFDFLFRPECSFHVCSFILSIQGYSHHFRLYPFPFFLSNPFHFLFFYLAHYLSWQPEHFWINLTHSYLLYIYAAIFSKMTFGSITVMDKLFTCKMIFEWGTQVFFIIILPWGNIRGAKWKYV